MKILKLFRYGLWGMVGLLTLLIGYDYVTPKPQDPQNSAIRISQFAAPLPDVAFADHPWQVVNFFASWCVPCRAEHPLLLELSKELPIIGISWKDLPADSQKFLEELGSPFQQVVFDPDGALTRPWRIQGLPATFLIDASGKIRYRRLGLVSEGHVAQIRALIKNAEQ